MTGHVRRSWWGFVVPIGALGACVEVHAGTDCLTVTEVSSARPGRVAFDRDTCRPREAGCDGDTDLADGFCTCPTVLDDRGQADWYCPDYVELCNRSEIALVDSSTYEVANHHWLSQPNPWAPVPEPIGWGLGPELIPGACVVFALESHEDDDGVRSELCATNTGLEMDTRARLTVLANHAGRSVCEFEMEFGPTRLDKDQVWQLPHGDGRERHLGRPSPGVDHLMDPR